jgi:Xaa-Pro aminopeptidase/Xaa-Pro dipeptidase
MDHLARQARARDAISAAGLDMLVISRMSNIRYLTGFTGSLGYLTLGESEGLVVDGRYGDQAGHETVGVPVTVVEGSTLVWPRAVENIRAASSRKVGIEGDTMTAAAFADASAAHPSLTITRQIVEKLRAVKDADEIAELRNAVALTDKMLADLPAVIKPGMTELEVAGYIELMQFQQGGLGSASMIIASSGPRTAIPHGLPTPRIIGANDPVMVDVGTSSGGYGADTTRTYQLGTADPKFREIYDVVYESQQRGVDAVKPGRTGREVDAEARKIIDDAGYGQYFGHSLGHSIGLDYHEKPLLSPFDETVLEPGMVLTVEPGVYIDGFGGVRIEDMVVVTEDGCENLTVATRELLEL